jgi:hypothetical protein
VTSNAYTITLGWVCAGPPSGFTDSHVFARVSIYVSHGPLEPLIAILASHYTRTRA